MKQQPRRSRTGRALVLRLCAACALAGLPIGAAVAQPGSEQGLAQRPDMQLSIRRLGAVEGGVVRDVELQGEAASEASAREYGYRSMRQVIDVDCTSRRDRVQHMEVFQSHAQRGAPASRRPPGQWAAPSPDAYLADVINAVCHGGTPKDAAAPRLLASASAPRPPAQAAPGPAPALASADPPAPVRPGPAAASPPKPVVFAEAKTPPPINLRPAAPLRSLPLAAVAFVKGPLSPPPRPAQAAGAWVAQVGATETPEGARRELDRLGALIGSGLAGRVETARVGGRMVYRATVAGFATRAEAGAFCAKVEQAGRGCWAR
jgi:hypothetical protein